MPDDPRSLDPTDEELSALVDGELEADRAAVLRPRIGREPSLADRLAAFEGVDAALQALPRGEVTAQLESRLRGRIAAASAEGPPPRRLPRRRGRWLAAAGGLAAAASLAWLLVGRSDLPGGTLPQVRPDPRVAELDSASAEEIAIAIDLGTVEDLELIEQLDFLERLEALEARGRG